MFKIQKINLYKRRRLGKWTIKVVTKALVVDEVPEGANID